MSQRCKKTREFAMIPVNTMTEPQPQLSSILPCAGPRHIAGLPSADHSVNQVSSITWNLKEWPAHIDVSRI